MTDPPGLSADVLVVGHATLDLERARGRADVERPGGAVLYAACAAARLGARTVALTRAPPRWAIKGLEPAAEAGAELVVRPSADVTRFELDCAAERTRRLRVTSMAPPFRGEDLRTVHARAILLGPLTAGELEASVFVEARARARLLAIGAQGLLRRVSASGDVRLEPPDDLAGLAACDVIACDALEASVLATEADPAAATRAIARRFPRAEVLVTAGADGAWVHAEGTTIHQPAIAPRTVVSSTGAGDTFLAAWVVARLEGRGLEHAARLAAAAASLSLEHAGPLRSDRARALARAQRSAMASREA